MKRILLAYTLSALCLLPAFAGGGEEIGRAHV